MDTRFSTELIIKSVLETRFNVIHGQTSKVYNSRPQVLPCLRKFVDFLSVHNTFPK